MLAELTPACAAGLDRHQADLPVPLLACGAGRTHRIHGLRDVARQPEA